MFPREIHTAKRLQVRPARTPQILLHAITSPCPLSPDHDSHLRCFVGDMAAYCRAQRWIIDDEAGLVSPGVKRLKATLAESQQQPSFKLDAVVVGGDGDTHTSSHIA